MRTICNCGAFARYQDAITGFRRTGCFFPYCNDRTTGGWLKTKKMKISIAVIIRVIIIIIIMERIGFRQMTVIMGVTRIILIVRFEAITVIAGNLLGSIFYWDGSFARKTNWTLASHLQIQTTVKLSAPAISSCGVGLTLYLYL